MTESIGKKLLFIINPGSGNGDIDWQATITDYFATLTYTIDFFNLPAKCDLGKINNKIAIFLPEAVIAVGGDGTVKLVAECLLKKNIPMGILPAGSANGLSKELGISDNPVQALNGLTHAYLKSIHAIRVNDELCIHLSDIGFNAFVIKKI